MRTRVKFCGCTTTYDVEQTVRAGADAFGMIFAPSPRRIPWSNARAIADHRPWPIEPVGVFVNPTLEEIAAARALFPGLAVQLSGEEPPEFVASIGGDVIKAIHVSVDATAGELEARCSQYAKALVLFDTKVAGMFGGTGARFDWSKIAQIARRRGVVVAGGLTPENVGACVRSVHPAWVDVRSGVESDGRKDEEKMERFIAAVRENDAA
jgi:phosphoribosylanthranilate isomerase